MRTHLLVALGLAACGPTEEVPTAPPKPADQPVNVVFINNASFALDSVLLDFNTLSTSLANMRGDEIPPGAALGAKIQTFSDQSIRLNVRVFGRGAYLTEKAYAVPPLKPATTALTVTLSDSAGATVVTLRDQDGRSYNERLDERTHLQQAIEQLQRKPL